MVYYCCTNIIDALAVARAAYINLKRYVASPFKKGCENPALGCNDRSQRLPAKAHRLEHPHHPSRVLHSCQLTSCHSFLLMVSSVKFSCANESPKNTGQHLSPPMLTMFSAKYHKIYRLDMIFDSSILKLPGATTSTASSLHH